MKSFAYIAAAMLATTAIPAAAKPIAYTFNGTFGGTIAGQAFTNTNATFTGKGDTSNTGTAFGYASILSVSLSSLSAFANPTTFTITTPSFFYLYDSSLFGTAGDRLGLGFDNSGVNALGLESTAFDGYDGLSSFNLTPASVYFQNATFDTNAGTVVIDSFTNGSFSALAVPEPATWAFMIVGFGAIGGAMRRRNRQVLTTVRFA